MVGIFSILRYFPTAQIMGGGTLYRGFVGLNFLFVVLRKRFFPVWNEIDFLCFCCKSGRQAKGTLNEGH
jgi:hypothetical protein